MKPHLIHRHAFLKHRTHQDPLERMATYSSQLVEAQKPHNQHPHNTRTLYGLHNRWHSNGIRKKAETLRNRKTEGFCCYSITHIRLTVALCLLYIFYPMCNCCIPN